MLLTVKSAAAEDEQAVVALWRACDLAASYNDPVADFRFATAGPCSDVLVAVDDAGEVLAASWSAMTGIEAGCTTLPYIAQPGPDRLIPPALQQGKQPFWARAPASCAADAQWREACRQAANSTGSSR